MRLVKLLPISVELWLLNRERCRKFRSEELGLTGPPTKGPIPTGEIINDNFIQQVFCGRILPKPGIKTFTNNGVVFTDGSQIENLNVVMFCTGYHSTMPLIEEKIIPGMAFQQFSAFILFTFIVFPYLYSRVTSAFQYREYKQLSHPDETNTSFFWDVHCSINIVC